MNDQELERMLRTRIGPRERGYQAGTLPPSIARDDRSSARSRVLHMALLSSAAVAGALTVAIGVALVLSGSPGPEAGTSPTLPLSGTSAATPSTIPSPDATDVPHVICAWRSLVLDTDPWGGAAGSRGTVVTVSLVVRAEACQLSRDIGVRISDRDGVMQEGTSGESGSVVLEPGAQYTFAITWSNWCGDPPSGVMGLEARIGNSGWWAIGGQPQHPGSVMPEEVVPPCMGAGQPSVLNIRGLQPIP